jgi:hypothetical protein
MTESRPLLPRVTKVKTLDNFELLLEFKDGAVKSFDVKPYLDFPAFQRLKVGGAFAKAHVSHGTVVWDDMLDLAPETLYLKGVSHAGLPPMDQT